jgi:hypothetical protein
MISDKKVKDVTLDVIEKDWLKGHYSVKEILAMRAILLGLSMVAQPEDEDVFNFFVGKEHYSSLEAFKGLKVIGKSDSLDVLVEFLEKEKKDHKKMVVAISGIGQLLSKDCFSALENIAAGCNFTVPTKFWPGQLLATKDNKSQAYIYREYSMPFMYELLLWMPSGKNKTRGNWVGPQY